MKPEQYQTLGALVLDSNRNLIAYGSEDGPVIYLSWPLPKPRDGCRQVFTINVSSSGVVESVTREHIRE